MPRSVWTKHNREMDERIHPSLPQERWPRNYKELQRHNSAITAAVYNALLLNRIRPKFEKILRKISQTFLKEWIYSLADSDNSSNHRRSTSKESQGNTTVRRFLQSIRFHLQTKDGTNTSWVWFPWRNCYSYNDALQKYESNGSFSWWRQRLLWHKTMESCKEIHKHHVVFILLRLCTLNVRRSNKKWFKIKKQARSRLKHTTQTT